MSGGQQPGQAHRRSNGKDRSAGFPTPAADDAGGVMPNWLAEKFDALPNDAVRLSFSKKIGANGNYRTRVQVGVAALHHNGWTVDQAVDLAAFFPTGFGALRDSAPAVIREVWNDQEKSLADAAKAEKVAKENAARLYDPWRDPTPPEWPGGVLSREAEDTIAALSIADGVDFGAQALAYIAAASGAAPKNARFAPYSHSRWTVPPILWVMQVADSGQRKTAILENAFAALRLAGGRSWGDYKTEKRRWDILSDEAKKGTPKPTEPHSLVVQDLSPEKLQVILADNPRGTLLLKDELASLFDFGRYGTGSGGAERAFYLEAYEGNPYTVSRIGRETVHIESASLAIFGSIQPDRLAAFKDLESDGLLQRFLVMRPTRAAVERPDVPVPKKERLDASIERLASLTGRAYSATPEGANRILATRRLGAELAIIADYGKGFQGFASKLAGTHARLALVLQMMESPDQELVSNDAIERAELLIRRFLLPHARDFYATLPDSSLPMVRDIAGWLLTKAPPRVLASDLTSAVWSCRSMGIKRIAEVLDPLVAGGWLEPEEPFPSNRTWLLNPDLRVAFAGRASAERDRRAKVRRLMDKIDQPKQA